jgi:hypothetical protein
MICLDFLNLQVIFDFCCPASTDPRNPTPVCIQNSRVADPDPDSTGSVDPDPDPGGQKWPTKVEKNFKSSCFEVLDGLC